MLRILLITPGRRIHAGAHLDAILRSAVAPADLTTIAGLTPKEHRVDIWDEAIRGKLQAASDLRRRYDIIGVGGYSSDGERSIAIGRLLRGISTPLVVGGVGVSSEPERYRNHFDVLFIGEAEYTWPRFLLDFQAGKYKTEYRQVGRVSMEDSPPPKWSAIAADLAYYAWGVVQTTRGCPFDCEFCDVITLFGRQPRHKPIDQVLHEVEALRRLGVRAIMLSDDNFYGNKSYGKPLLRRLAEYNRSLRKPLRFWTQISLNVSKDDEMLSLLAEANVSTVLIGIESPNMESLVETNKPQNYRLDIKEALKKVQSYGLRIEASLIVGFDHDDETIFQRQFEFIQETCLSSVSIWPLTAMPGTKLWVRLKKENRVLKRYPFKKLDLHGGLVCNVVPRQMTLEELLRGYRDLLKRVHEWSAFRARLEGLIANMKRHPPLMPGFKAISWARVLKLSAYTRFKPAARRDLLRQTHDPEAKAVLIHLLRLVPGESPRERYLQSFIRQAVNAEWNLINYELPKLYRSIDEDLAQLAVGGRALVDDTTFFVPEAFKGPFRAVFPAVHERVQNGLVDKTRTEVALVEIFHDFLTRWGSSFERLEEHHQVQLWEICDRTVARENGVSDPGDSPAPQPWVRIVPDARASIQDYALRRAATDVLRCVEEEFRRQGQAPQAPATPATAH
jgi:radical SAM superfamily enzyme YgiQ (UPF0313 family)